MSLEDDFRVSIHEKLPLTSISEETESLALLHL